VSLLPNCQQADEHISSFTLKLPTPELEGTLKINDMAPSTPYIYVLIKEKEIIIN